MATIDKKYLDQAGLQHLIDEKAIVKHPSPAAKDAAAVKVGTDANGHVVLGAALSYNDLQNLPTIGEGKLTIQVNGKAVTGTFTANQTGDTIINITAADLGLASGMRFVGISGTDPNGPSGATVSGYTDWRAGDVVIYMRSGETSYEEYILTTSGNIAANWELLGDASSYAMKDVTITAGAGLTGGGDLSQNRTISHAQDATKAKDPAAVKVGSDAFGHVVLGAALGIAEDGAHGHSVSATIPAETFVDDVTHTDTHLALDKKTVKAVTAVPGAFNKLERASIIGVAADTVTVSKATAGAAVAVATVGDAVNYGTADVGFKATVAVKAAEATTIGNANRATTGTPVGNADVGDEFTAGSADVGSATRYGTANVGDSATVATLSNANAIFGNANRATAATTVATGLSGTAYEASYVENDECLELTALTLNTTGIYEATASSTKFSSAIGTTSVTSAVAAPETQTLTPAKAATKKLYAAKALSGTSKSIYEAVESTKTIFGVGDTVEVTSAVAADATRKIVPAVANGTITPYTFTDHAVAVKADEKTFATGALSQTADGAEVMVGTGVLTTADALLDTTAIKAGATGDVVVVSEVSFNKNDAAKTISGTAAEAGSHDHHIV